MEHPAAVLTREAIKQQELAMLLNKSTPERRAIFEKLQEKKWFQKTDGELQKKLLTLPDKGIENHNGFLEDLANRPEEISNIKVERMIDLPHGSFALVPKFEVSRLDNPAKRFTYEYVSWRNGPLTGEKGVVFVEKNGVTTHFIVLRGEKFATGKKSWDSVGGFADLGVDGVNTVADRTVKELQEELGVPGITILRKVDLGTVNTDVGMTNNEPGIFAAFIDGADAAKISSRPINGDTYELQSGAVIFPMSELPKVVMTNTDSMFLSTIARAWAKGIIPPPEGMAGKAVGFSLN
ncbi:hypothetical protein KJZ67_02755 [Patescibacteria group bacterium]|nr:hypothetical protein [Patescibacteria group bacterium]